MDLEKKGIEVSQETQEIALQCLSGRPIEEKTVVKLVKEAIENNSRSIILDYPSTYEQAI
jgi:adenylate kinase family enzyme